MNWESSIATELQTGERELPSDEAWMARDNQDEPEDEPEPDPDTIPSLMELITKKNEELKEMLAESKDEKFYWDAKHGMI